MPILDVNHLRILQSGKPEKQAAFAERLNDSGEAVAATIVAVSESFRGMVNTVDKSNEAAAVKTYPYIQRMVEFFDGWEILEYGETERAELERISKMLKGIKRPDVQDLRQLAIASLDGRLLLTADKTLLNAAAVVGVRAENWLPEINHQL